MPFLPSGPWTAPAAPDVKSFIIYFVKASESNTCIKHVSLLFFLLLVSLCSVVISVFEPEEKEGHGEPRLTDYCTLPTFFFFLFSSG